MWTTSFSTIDQPRPNALCIGSCSTILPVVTEELASRGYNVCLNTWDDLKLDPESLARYRIVVMFYGSENEAALVTYVEGQRKTGKGQYILLISLEPVSEDSVLRLRHSEVDDYLLSPFEPGVAVHSLNLAFRLLETEDRALEEISNRTVASDALQSLNESLTAASKRFEALFNGLPVACFTFDREGLIQEWNSKSKEVFELEPYEVFMHPVWDALDPDRQGVWSFKRVSVIFENEEAVEFDWEFPKPDGTAAHLACKVMCLVNERGEKIAAVAGNLDITARVLAQKKIDEQVSEIQKYTKRLEKQSQELVLVNKKLELLSTTDGLTGLTNRRLFQEQLTEHCERGMRNAAKNNFSLLILDVDHFKSLNDEYGHVAGDEVLRELSVILQRESRKFERPARYGGEEFVVLLEGCDRDAALLVGERFRKAVESHNWSLRKITVSVGIATYVSNCTPGQMIERADKALYVSKRQGRNRTTHVDFVPEAAHEHSSRVGNAAQSA